MNNCWVVYIERYCDGVRSFHVSQEAYKNLEDSKKFMESRSRGEIGKDSMWLDDFRYLVYTDSGNRDNFDIYETKEVTIV